MKHNMRFVVGMALSLFLFVSFLTGCTPVTPPPSTPHPRLTYTVSPCHKNAFLAQPNAWEHVSITKEGESIHIYHKLPYVCCAEIDVRLEQQDRVLKIVERNVGDVCRCMCGYEVDIRVTGLPAGTYTIQVWGVEYPQTGPSTLRGTAVLTISDR